MKDNASSIALAASSGFCLNQSLKSRFFLAPPFPPIYALRASSPPIAVLTSFKNIDFLIPLSSRVFMTFIFLPTLANPLPAPNSSFKSIASLNTLWYVKGFPFLNTRASASASPLERKSKGSFIALLNPVSLPF